MDLLLVISAKSKSRPDFRGNKLKGKKNAVPAQGAWLL